MNYFGSFNDKKDVESQFVVSLDNAKVLFAEYVIRDYCGDAWVIYQENGQLYEVFGSHCSCNGLSDCWSPEKTSVEEILYRIEQGGQSMFNIRHVQEILSSSLDLLPLASELIEECKKFKVKNLVKDNILLQDENEQMIKFKTELIKSLKLNIEEERLKFKFQFSFNLNKSLKDIVLTSKDVELINDYVSNKLNSINKTLIEKNYSFQNFECEVDDKEVVAKYEFDLLSVKNNYVKKKTQQMK